MILSTQNPQIKLVAGLRDRRVRETTREFLVEGRLEFERARKHGFEISRLYFCPDIFSEEARQIFEGCPEVVPVSTKVFAKIAMRENRDGFVGVFRQKPRTLSDIPEVPNMLVLVVEGIEKPGNLGALLRTADGMGAHGVILVGAALDIYNPNVVRASLGALFSVPTVATTFVEFAEWSSAHGLELVTTWPSAKNPYFDCDLTGPTALVMGGEAFGLSAKWHSLTTREVSIPMLGTCDSLNISVAAAILGYEALRQRFR